MDQNPALDAGIAPNAAGVVVVLDGEDATGGIDSDSEPASGIDLRRRANGVPLVHEEGLPHWSKGT
jgi:hypothetical protein